MRFIYILTLAIPLLTACGDEGDKTSEPVAEAEPCGDGYARDDNGDCQPIATTGGEETGGEENNSKNRS